MESVSYNEPIADALPTPSALSSSTSISRDSTVLRRLMEEVRCEEMITLAGAAYNRQHNRHNR